MEHTLRFSYFEFHWPIDLSIDLTNILILLMSVIALVFTYIEVIKERKRDRELKERHREEDLNARMLELRATSKHLYMDYLKLALDNPEMANAIYDEKNEVSAARYDYYTSTVFWIFDEYLQTDDYRFCIPAFKSEIKTHEKYLRSLLHGVEGMGQEYRAGYSEKFLSILDSTFDELDSERSLAAREKAGSAT